MYWRLIFCITYSYKNNTIFYICDFPYPLSYESISALLLYTDLYVVILNS